MLQVCNCFARVPLEMGRGWQVPARCHRGVPLASYPQLSSVFWACCYIPTVVVVNSTSNDSQQMESPNHHAPRPFTWNLTQGDQPPSLASTLACFGKMHRCGLCDRCTTSIASPSTSLDLPRQSMLGEQNRVSLQICCFQTVCGRQIVCLFGWCLVGVFLFASSFLCTWVLFEQSHLFLR